MDNNELLFGDHKFDHKGLEFIFYFFNYYFLLIFICVVAMVSCTCLALAQNIKYQANSWVTVLLWCQCRSVFFLSCP